MAMNKLIKIVVISIFAAVFIIGIILTFIYTSSYKVLSPNEQYQASYNRYSKIITVEELDTEKQCYISGYDNPSFLWSQNSRFLAINFSNSGRRAEIIDMNNSTSASPPDKLTIQQLNKDLVTTDDNLDSTCIEVTKWLDNEHVVIEFSWPADEVGYRISGWFIYNIKSRSIKELNYKTKPS